MKKLTLIRHAKSSWDNPTLADFDRPLNARGERDLPALCLRIDEYSLRPEKILSSGAKRAEVTASAIADQLRLPLDAMQILPELYDACYETLLHTLQNQHDSLRHIMLVGHNPGIEELGYLLTHERLEKYPTCGMLHIHLSVTSWSELAESCGTKEIFDFPKLHAK